MGNLLNTMTEAAGIMRKASKLPPHAGKHKWLISAGYAHKGGGEYRVNDGECVFVKPNGAVYHFVAETAGSAISSRSTNSGG